MSTASALQRLLLVSVLDLYVYVSGVAAALPTASQALRAPLIERWCDVSQA